ncbi:hypothetical protein [Mesorhizobium sp. WSM2561]|uniref:hypothetical protein n=1 Tax=Mesorhizobium sp. WSM2561 TaxID=1040985 RepID=UPI0004B37129|nr:hypothetical protein [Mesorhizobium sp. WSM2561]
MFQALGGGSEIGAQVRSIGRGSDNPRNSGYVKCGSLDRDRFDQINATLCCGVFISA